MSQPARAGTDMRQAVYIVDDDDAVHASFHSLFSVRSKFAIHHFRSGDCFLADKDSLDPGVLLLDQDMPGATGMDVLESIGHDPRFVTILVTGHSDIALAVRAMKAGARDFLQKPYDATTMLETVDGAASQLEARQAEAADIDAARARFNSLSPRERDVIEGLIKGQANKAIARELGISPRTVEIYRCKMMKKLKVKSLAAALRIAFVTGLLPVRDGEEIASR
jgi:two-component system response regulator FixJ